MNAIATVQDFGFQGLSDFITIDKVRESAKRIGLTVHSASGIQLSPGNRFYGGGEMKSISFSEGVYAQPTPGTRFYGGVEMQPIGIAESVKDFAVNAAYSLSPLLRQRISELANLSAGWDGEGAKPVKPHVLADAVETLRRLSLLTGVFHEPFVAPTFDGLVQLEWHGDRRSLDLEAVGKGWSAVGTLIGSDGKRHYFTAEFERNDFSQVAKFYHWFWGDELIWPSL
jgi:hypothetical protein